MKRNKRSKADISNIYLARILSSQGKNFFIFTNDKDQITQSKIEGFKYMRPIQFLVWMVKDKYITRQKKYITRQKAVWIFEKTKKQVDFAYKKGYMMMNCSTMRDKGITSPELCRNCPINSRYKNPICIRFINRR